MNWEQVKSAIDSFTDKPIVVALTSVLAFAVVALVILSKTSVGKKAIKKLTGLYLLGKERGDVTLQKVNDIQKLATEKIEALKADYEKKADDLKNEYEKKAAVLLSVVNYYEETFFGVLEDIPNAKVQAKLKVFKENYQEKKAAISETVGELYDDFNAAIERNKEEIEHEYSEKIDFLSDEIKKLNLYISELKGGKFDG